MTYDLLIKGGHVLDPGQGLDGIRDIAITDGKITKIAAGIPAARTRTASWRSAAPAGTSCRG